VVLAIAITALAALAVGSIGTAATKQGAFQASFNTDTAGLNDKSFNHLGNIGRLKAQKDLGIQTKVYISATEADYLPNAVAATQWGAKAVVMNGFLLADATNTAAKQFPNVKWAITDFPRVALADQPTNAYGLTFKSEESGFLVGYLAAQMAKATSDRRASRPASSS
jgi:basic membrane protein A